MEKKVFVCEDSPEGIFTGVYEAYERRFGHENCRLKVAGEGNLELFTEYIEVAPDPEKAEKVIRTLRRKFGDMAYRCLYFAVLSWDPDKAEAVYKAIVAGLAMEQPWRVMDHLSCEPVAKVQKLYINLRCELDHMKGFLRFQELDNQVLLAIIRPKNHLCMLLAEHFADRLPQEHWMIYDEGRKEFAVHEANRQFAMVQGEELNIEAARQYAGQEQYFQALWGGFCKSISIPERENTALQQQNLPLRFRGNMVEFARRGFP